MKANPLIRNPAGIVAGNTAFVGTNMAQPPETMETPRKLHGRQLQFKRGLLPGIENPTGKRIATVENFFGNEGINRPQIGRCNNHTIDPETTQENEWRGQDGSRLPHLPPGFGNVKRNQSSAIIDSHTGSCNRILMIQPFPVVRQS